MATQPVCAGDVVSESAEQIIERIDALLDEFASVADAIAERANKDEVVRHAIREAVIWKLRHIRPEVFARWANLRKAHHE